MKAGTKERAPVERPAGGAPSKRPHAVTLSREAAAWVRHFALERTVPEEQIIARLVEERLFIYRLPLETVLELAKGPQPVMPLAAGELAGEGNDRRGGTTKLKGNEYIVALSSEAADWVERFAAAAGGREAGSEAAADWAERFAAEANRAAADIVARLVEERLFLFRMEMETVLALANGPLPLAKVEAELVGLQTMPPESFARRATMGAPSRRTTEEEATDTI